MPSIRGRIRYIFSAFRPYRVEVVKNDEVIASRDADNEALARKALEEDLAAAKMAASRPERKRGQAARFRFRVRWKGEKPDL